MNARRDSISGPGLDLLVALHVDDVVRACHPELRPDQPPREGPAGECSSAQALRRAADLRGVVTANVDASAGPTGCWPWTGTRSKKGYGRFKVGGRARFGHRVVLEEKLGRALEADELACHSCDNPPCCNPAHLFAGSVAENNADRVAKGRTARGDRSGSRRHPESYRGSRNGSARLTEHAVADIRRRLSAGDRPAVLAAEFGVSRGAIYFVASGETWAHVQADSNPGLSPG